MPGFNTLRYANGYYNPSAAAIVEPAIVELESANNTIDSYVVKYTPDGKALWAARIGSAAGTDIGYSTHSDSNGNIYVTGATSSGGNIIAFNADGTQFDMRIFSSAGGTDVFIVKYNTSGVVQWVARIASTADDIGYGAVVDSGGNVYVTGQGGTGVVVTAYNANGTAFSLTILNNGGGNNAFLVKYNTDGAVQWRAQLASSGNDIGFSMAVDSSGNVYMTGSAAVGSAAATVVTAYSWHGGGFYNTFSSAGGSDAFIVKYESIGNVQWLARISSTGNDIGYGVAVDSGGNVYVTGGGSNTVVTAYNAAGTAFATTLASAGAGDVFLVKYNTSGVVQWVARIASTAADIGYGVAVDSAGDVYVTGQTGSGAVTTAYNSTGTAFATTLASVGLTDVFLIKYNTSGAVQWVTRLGSTAGDIGYGIAMDSGNNVYLTGQSGPANVFTIFNSNGTTFGTLANTSAAATDAFLVKYNSSGIAQWGQKLASSAADIGRGITVDPTGNMIVVGSYIGMRHSIYGQTLSLFSSTTSVGAGDAFIVKYNTNGSPQWTARIVSTGTDIGNATAIDSDGNLYVVGQAASGVSAGAVVTAYNSNGSAFGTTFSSRGGYDVFIVKYDSSGSVQWIARIASTGHDNGYGVAVDSGGNVYVTGGGSAAVVTAYNSDGSEFATTLASAGAGDAFIVKYNTSGVVQWLARIGSTGGDAGRGVAVDSDGNIYVGGYYGNATTTAYNADGSAFARTLTSMGLNDAFIVKYNTSGSVQWLAQIAGSGNDLAYGVATYSNTFAYVFGVAGAATTTAYGFEGAPSGSGSVAAGNSFIAKYAYSGYHSWTLPIVGGAINDMTVDSAGNLFCTGTMASSVAFYSQSGILYRTLTGTNDAWLVKYNAIGTPQWVVGIASTGTEVAGKVSVDSLGNVYMSGKFAPNANLTITDMRGGSTITSALGNVAIIKFDTLGQVTWIQSIGSSQQTTYSVSATLTGDVYVAGQTGTSNGQKFQVFYSDLTPYKVLSSAGGQDAYVVKYSAAMIPQWAALISTAGLDTGFGIALDSTANVYVAVQCNGTGPNAFVTTVYNADGSIFGTVATAGEREAILVKYNSSGTGQWTARFATQFFDTGRGVATDSAGNVFFVGGCGNQQVVMFNSDGSTFASFAQSGGGDAIVTKYDGSGFGHWYARIASTVAEVAYSAATDISGNVYVTGIGPFAAGMDIFNANGTQFGTLTGIGQNDVFLVKYNTSGVVQWAAKAGSTAADIGYGTTVDSSGDVYIAGQTGSGAVTTAYNADGSAFATTLASLGLTDGFLIKYNTAGVVQWVTRMGGTGADIAYGVTTDSSSNVYVTGSFTGTGTFYSSDGAAFATTLANAGVTDIFLAKYNSAGTVQWVARIGGSLADVGYTIQVNSAGDVYVGGQYTGSINAYNADNTFFGSSAPAFNYGGALSVIVKYNSSGVVQWISQSQGAGANAVQNMVLDSASNLYATGFITNGTFVPGST